MNNEILRKNTKAKVCHQWIIMKIKYKMLALCFSLIVATVSCNNANSKPSSGSMGVCISDTSVNFYFANAFCKNKKPDIVLAFWDNMLQNKSESSCGSGENSTDMTCHLTKSDSTIKFECIAKFDKKTGKGEVKINGKIFDGSNGRLFLINTRVKPIKVIQVNEQFNLPPFNDLSYSDEVFSSNKRIRLKAMSSALSTYEKKFEYLAKNNKEVVAFLAQSNSPVDKPKAPSGKE